MYQSLFGLKGRFTREDIRHAYRTLAKLNHPDVNNHDTSSQMRMIIINEAYKFLNEILDNDELDRFIMEDNEISKDEDIDRVYRQYRRGFDILKEAFDRYYGDQKTADEGNIHVLREKLSLAKEEFARIVTDFPYNQWVDDAIDRINSINKWLGNYQV
jgi:DnaJ-class molecular chaperone